MATETPNQQDAYATPSLSSLSGRRKKPAVGQDVAPARPSLPEAPAQSLGDEVVPQSLGQPLDTEEPLAAPRPRRTRRQPVAAPAGEQAGDLPVSFSVSEGVRRRLDSAQAKALTSGKRRKGHLEFIFESLEAANAVGWATVVGSSVPEAAPRRFGANRAPRDREYAGTGPETLYVRLSRDELEEIEAATTEAKVPDRNKLVAMCLNWHLPGRKDKPSPSA